MRTLTHRLDLLPRTLTRTGIDLSRLLCQDTYSLERFPDFGGRSSPTTVANGPKRLIHRYYFPTFLSRA